MRQFISAINNMSAHDYGVLIQRYGLSITDALPVGSADITPRPDGTFDWGGSKRAVIVPVVVDGEIIDVIAFNILNPGRMLRFTRRAHVLYGDAVEPIAIASNADEWLLRRCRGQVLLDPAMAWECYAGHTLQVDDIAAAARLGNFCKPPASAAVRIVVRPFHNGVQPKEARNG